MPVPLWKKIVAGGGAGAIASAIANPTDLLKVRLQTDGMAKDAEGHAEADKLKREQIETKNEADAAVHNTRKNLNEHKDNLPTEVHDQVHADITTVEQLLAEEDSDPEEIRKAVDTLQQSAMKMGEAIYKNSSTPAEEPQAEDAEFKDVKEEKEEAKEEEGEKKDEKK